ncbi:MAG: choline-sulfatase [Candidatus Latescibacteria bacterium]|nr:choline-sulfatase [Candidatus Latescibacterota bacterium]
MESRPNILMIMADQLPAQTIGAYGHRMVKTPHMDALVERGTVFDSAYTNCPICSPSRASMCTGQYVSKIGAFDNGTDFLSSTPTFMHHLRRAGYQVVLSGKMHFVGPDQMHGFERRLTPEIYPSSFVWTPDWTKGAYHNPGTAVDQVLESGLCDWSMQLDYDEEVSFRALEALRDFARKEDPFFLCASYTHPHEPFYTTREWWDLYDRDAIDMPAVGAILIEEMHPYDQWLQIHHMVDVYEPDEASIRNARHAFYGMVSYFDHQVGRLVRELERLGLAENTVIVVTSDHGEMLGEHGMWYKRTYFDPSTRVPLIFCEPGVQEGQRVREAVSLVDLFPTFLDLGGLKDFEAVQETVDGDSLCEVLAGNRSDWKDFALSEYYSEGVCQPMRMGVSGGLKYVYVHDEIPQLFDLRNDCNEESNCVDDLAYADRLDVLKRQVHEGWDPVAMRKEVVASQQRRHVINEAQKDTWDVQPSFDASKQYVRGEGASDASRRLRLPKFE